MGREREAVIEIVRSADYAAFIIHSSSGEESLDDESLDELRLILNGVAPALATFLPLMKGGRGLPFGPATPQLADWIEDADLDTGCIRGHEHEVVCQSANLLGFAIKSETHRVNKNVKVRAIVVFQNGRKELEHWMPMQIWRQIADGEPALGIA